MIEVTDEERFRAKLRSQRMYQTDLASDLATAEDRGERRGRLEVARNLIGRMPDEEIANVAGLAIEEVRSLHTKEDECISTNRLKNGTNPGEI